MRARTIAIGIAAFAALDLMVLTLAPLFGWLDLPSISAPWGAAMLGLAFLLAVLALVGAVSVILTDTGDAAPYESWFVNCGECGRAPDLTLAFCDHCGADA